MIHWQPFSTVRIKLHYGHSYEGESGTVIEQKDDYALVRLAGGGICHAHWSVLEATVIEKGDDND